MQTIEKWGKDGVEFTYSQLTQNEIAILAGNKPKDIPEGEPYDLSDEAKEITNEAASVTDEVTTVSLETSGTPQKVNMAKQISLDSDIINEPIEFIQEEFNTILDSIPETDIENRNLVTSYLENTLKRQQSSQGSSDKAQEKKQDTTEFTFETDINISDRPIINKIIEVESSGNPNAVSDHGAKGLMQLKDSTADNPGLGVRPAVRNADGSISPEENVRVGTDYFDALTEKYGGDLVTAAMAYNAGMGTIDKWIDEGRDFSKLRTETQNYVKKIFGEDTYNELKNVETVPESFDKMNPGEKLRYNKTLNRLNKAKEKLEDSGWLDNASQNTIKAQQDVVEKSTKELQSIVDKAGTSFFISLLTPESERLQQRIDVVAGKLENENLSTNQRKKLESDLERLETEFDNL
jgi:soluble lytic murein transglycosylase